jgi:hypothetical protein
MRTETTPTTLSFSKMNAAASADVRSSRHCARSRSVWRK